IRANLARRRGASAAVDPRSADHDKTPRSELSSRNEQRRQATNTECPRSARRRHLALRLAGAAEARGCSPMRTRRPRRTHLPPFGPSGLEQLIVDGGGPSRIQHLSPRGEFGIPTRLTVHSAPPLESSPPTLPKPAPEGDMPISRGDTRPPAMLVRRFGQSAGGVRSHAQFSRSPRLE